MKNALSLLLTLCCIVANAQPVTQPVAGRYFPLAVYSAKYTDVYATRSNAAALAQLSQSGIALYAERRFMLANLQLFQFSGAFTAGDGAFAVHGSYFGFSQLSQSQFSAAYGRKLGKKIDGGLQFNYYSLRQGAGYGNAYSVNASAAAIFHLTEKVHAGLNIYNPLGSKWSKTADEKIPAQYTLGIGYDASDEVYLSAEVVKEENLPASVNAGLQYRFNKQFFARGGVSTATSSYFLSVGFVMDAFRADVVGSYQSPLGISPGLMLSFQLGKKKINKEAANENP